jgi:hypothetical protein
LRNGVSEGFYNYWLNNPTTDSYPINFFMTAAYHNALDGKITPLLAYDSVSIPINLYNAYNYVKYSLVSLNGVNEYSIEMDNTKTGYNFRTIDISGTKINLDLYIPNIT